MSRQATTFPIPVLFLVFNRPDTTQLVFNAIRKRKPGFLFIAADGPRPGNEQDAVRCQQVRSIVSRIDWTCQLKTLFRETNLGCRIAVSEAISWFFENVEEGIILEDDCLPDPSFFEFCQALLEHYRENTNVMHISGDNFQSGRKRGGASYYFSRIAHVWGWASWRRAWHLYDVSMSDWPLFKNSKNLDVLFDHRGTVIQYWTNILEKVYEGKIDTWDYQWQFHIWKKGGFAVIPNVNLVSNIGFGNQATHTREITRFASLKTGSISKVKHPYSVVRHMKADDFFFRDLGILLGRKDLLYQFFQRVKYKIIRMIKY